MVKKLIVIFLGLSAIIFSFLFLANGNYLTADKNEITYISKSETKINASKALTYYKDVPEIKGDNSINVLILGLDGRVGDSRPRCDGIHMLSYLEAENKVIITSVPRGTYINLPGVDKESAYISNACHIKGIDYAVLEIERITEIHPDYIVKIGFSQATGIFRLLKLPTTSTLQYLRNRRTTLGDFQRSHNQAVFIKDAIVNYFDTFMSYPKTLKYLGFTLVDTDMEYNQAIDLLEKIQKSGLHTNPDNIILTIRPAPNYYLSDNHFNFSETNVFDQEFEDYQNYIYQLSLNIIQSTQSLLNANNRNIAFQKVSVPFNQKLWEQIEDEQVRNQLHYDLLKLYVLSSESPRDNMFLIKDFIEQMEFNKDLQMVEKGQELLGEVNI